MPLENEMKMIDYFSKTLAKERQLFLPGVDRGQFRDEPFGAVEGEHADGVVRFQAQLDKHFGHLVHALLVFSMVGKGNKWKQ